VPACKNASRDILMRSTGSKRASARVLPVHLIPPKRDAALACCVARRACRACQNLMNTSGKLTNLRISWKTKITIEVGCLSQPIRWELRMRCSGNLFDVLMPSPADQNNHDIQKIFHTIFLERSFNNKMIVCTITVEAGANPGARVVCETYRSNELQENKSVEYSSLDAAVVEAGRLAHNKMRCGFHYRLASADTSFRNNPSLAVA
jgi:hypothetical protein